MCQGNSNTQRFLLLGDCLKTWGKGKTRINIPHRGLLGLGKIESDFGPDMFTCLLCDLVQSTGTLWSSPAQVCLTSHGAEQEEQCLQRRSSPAPLGSYRVAGSGAWMASHPCGPFIETSCAVIYPQSQDALKGLGGLSTSRNCLELTNISLPSFSF